MSQSYAERAKQRRQDRVLKFPAGDYDTLFKGATLTTGRKPPYNKMVNIELKPITGPAEEQEKVDRLKEKNRSLVHRFVFSSGGFGFDDFLVFMEDLGADLSQCRPESEDPDYKDFMKILQELEFSPPRFKVNVSWPEEGGQFYNLRFLEIPKAFGAAAAPAAAPVAAPAAEIIYYMNGADVVKGSRDEVQALITNGYTGSVNINNTAWVSAIDAGFVMPVKDTTPPVAVAAAVAPAPAADPKPMTVDPTDNTVPEATQAALDAATTTTETPAPEATTAPVPETPTADAPAAATAAGAPVNPFG